MEQRAEDIDVRLHEARDSADLAALLRISRQRAGLTLHAVAAAMTRHGHQISVSTLSAWERGHHHPERASSIDLIPDLERLYGLEDGAIRELVPSSRPRPRERRSLMPADMPAPLRRLVAMAGDMPPLRIHSRHEFATIHAGRHRATISLRYLVEALEDGISHHLVLHEARGDRSPVLTGVTNCTVVEQWHEGDHHAYKVAFGRTLALGETHLFEWQVEVDGGVPLPDHVAHLVGPMTRQVVIQVRFEELPARVWSSRWAAHDAVPQDLERLMPDREGSVHLLATRQTEPALLGIRWEW